MICRFCGGQVTWRGPITNLTHTQCHDCGEQNCQLEEDTVDHNNGHHAGCRCCECRSGEEPMTNGAGRRLDLMTTDPVEFDRQVSLAEREYEDRLFGGRG